MRAEIGEILASVLEVPVTEAVARGFGPAACASWDSFRHLRIVMELEDRFSCVFLPREIPRLVSIPAIEELLREKCA